MRAPRGIRSSKLYLYGYFALVMLAGGVALRVLPSWGGEGELGFLDALFTSVSAVAVTGLITVNTANFTPLGQSVILVLIQLGGLGIIAFSTIHLTGGRRRISLQRRAVIREYFIGSVEHEPRRILRNIVISTLVIEALLAVALLPGFIRHGVERPVFTAVFHAVSAFCNAGFSTFADSLEGFVASPEITLPIAVGLVLGGLGFVVYQDIARRVTKHRHVLSLHTKIILLSTVVLIAVGFLVFLLVEWDGAFATQNTGQKLLSALFQSVTPRTAGFNTVPQADLSAPGSVFTIVLMFVGGAPGSIAGGVKVTTVFIILMAALGQTDDSGDARVFHRKIPSQLVARATLFFVRALMILVGGIFMLTVTEIVLAGNAFTFRDLIFETFSAFGTVGLSTGITGSLSAPGKLVIIATMFAGRVGLISLAVPSKGRRWRSLIDYPRGEVLIG
ncbi:MAG: TrkH family potassium uptake protein [Spirochaetota bacterium]